MPNDAAVQVEASANTRSRIGSDLAMASKYPSSLWSGRPGCVNTRVGRSATTMNRKELRHLLSSGARTAEQTIRGHVVNVRFLHK